MATRNLVPRGNNEGSLGIDGQRWSALHVASISTDTLKVTNIQLKANDNLSLFTKGAGIEDISTNGNGQFVIAMDDVFLTGLGFNADGSKPDFAGNGTVLAGDSFVSAINKLDTAVSNVADPSDLDTTNFANNIIDTDLSAVAATDTTLASAKAIKTYVDAQVTAQDLDLQGDAGDALSIDLDSQTLTIAGGTGLTSTGAGQTLTLALDDTAVTAGSYGSTTAIPTFTVDDQGRLTAAGTAAISTSLTIQSDDAADNLVALATDKLKLLGGTGITSTNSDDDVTFNLNNTAVTPGAYGTATAIPTFTVDQQGRLTAAGTVGITTTLTVDSDNAGTQDVSLADDDLQILGGTGLTSAIAKANNEVTVTMTLDDTAVTPGTYGDANSVSQVTVDQQGRITGASSIDIEIPKGQVTNFDEEVQDLVGAQLATNGTHTGISAAYDDNGDGAIDLTVTGLTLEEFAGAVIQTETEIKDGGDGAAGFVDNDTSVLTAAAIKQYIEAQGFGQGSGDISRVNITAGTGLSGSVDTAAGDHTQTLSLSNTGVTNVAEGESFGSATQVATFTVDQQGRLTAASNSAITIASTSISDFTEAVEDTVGAQFGGGTHAGISVAYTDDEGETDGAISLSVSAGTAHIQDEAVTAAKLNDDVISGQTELAAGLVATDELLVSDAGVIKRMDTSVLQTFMQDNLTFTTNTDVDVSKANLLTRLSSYDSNDTVNIGDADNDTSVVIRGNLTVKGTTTTVDSTTVSIQNAFVFEGASSDEHETTLSTIDPTADRSITLPDQSGSILVLDSATADNDKNTAVTSTPSELNLLDGSIADTVVNGKAVIYSDAGKIRGGLTGNADTATKLAAAVDIGGVSFDGSASINLPGVNAAGNQDTSGNAGTATALENARTIGMTGDVVWTSAAFSGSGNVTGTSTIQDNAITGAKIDIISDSAITNAKLANSTVSFGGVSLSLGGSEATPAFDLTNATNYPTSSLSGTITNAQLAGSIANGKLANSSVSFGGVSLSLGASDATPAFDLTDATNYPTSSLSGTITNAQLAGSIANGKLANSSVSFGGVSLSLGGSDATPAFDLTDATNYPTSSLSGTITNAQLAGSIANGKLENSTVSFGGVSLALGASDATPAFDLTDATGYPTSSLSGTITNAQLAGSISNDKLSTITTANKISIPAINLSGGTATNEALTSSDLILVEDVAVLDAVNNSTGRKKATLENLVTFFQNNTSLTSLSSLAGVGTITSGTWQGTEIADAYVANDLTINDGTVDNSIIGANTAAAGTFTTLTANTSLTINGTTTVTQILDEDNMASDSATSLATQQSIKKYVDDQITAQDLDFATDTGAGGTVDLDSQTLTIQGTSDKIGVTHANQTITVNVGTDIVQLAEAQTLTNKTLTSPVVSGLSLSDSSIVFEGATSDDFETTLSVEDPTADRTVTIPNATDTLVGRATTDTLTNKSIDADNNTVTNLEVDNLKAGVLDTDLSAVAETDTTLASAKAIKSYVDDQLGRFGGIFKTDKANDNGKEIVTTRSQALGIDYDYTRDVIFEAAPIVRSHFGPFAYSLKDLRDSAGDQGSDIIFFGATSTGASDRHFQVIGTAVEGVHAKGDCLFTGAHEETP